MPVSTSQIIVEMHVPVAVFESFEYLIVRYAALDIFKCFVPVEVAESCVGGLQGSVLIRNIVVRLNFKGVLETLSIA